MREIRPEAAGHRDNGHCGVVRAFTIGPLGRRWSAQCGCGWVGTDAIDQVGSTVAGSDLVVNNIYGSAV